MSASSAEPQRRSAAEARRSHWGYDDLSGTDVVRVTVYRLRRKRLDDAGESRLLHTVAGVGVMLKPVQ